MDAYGQYDERIACIMSKIEALRGKKRRFGGIVEPVWEPPLSEEEVAAFGQIKVFVCRMTIAVSSLFTPVLGNSHLAHCIRFTKRKVQLRTLFHTHWTKSSISFI